MTKAHGAGERVAVGALVELLVDRLPHPQIIEEAQEEFRVEDLAELFERRVERVGLGGGGQPPQQR
jgi:hypothetical protein